MNKSIDTEIGLDIKFRTIITISIPVHINNGSKGIKDSVYFQQPSKVVRISKLEFKKYV